MNGVFHVLPKGVFAFVYADDILLVTAGKTAARTRIRAQAAVRRVADWTKSVGFQLSPAKSVRCHVCATGHQVKGPPICVDGTPIPTKRSVKVLGVAIDRNLSFEQHFRAVKAACKTRVNLIKAISRPHRTNNRDIRFRVAGAIINSRLLYGLELTVLASDRLAQVLEPVYNNYIRVVSGLLPSTPAVAACVDAGKLPFRFVLGAAVAKRAASILAKTSGNNRIFLLDEVDRLLRRLASQVLPPVTKCHWHGARSWQMHRVKTDGRIGRAFRAGENHPGLRSAVAEILGSRYRTHAHRYTDGSKTTSGVGFGVASESLTACHQLPSACSVFTAELAAIFVAVTTPADRPILVVTDSMSAITALKSEVPSHPTVQAILRYAPASTVFMWVPGHCGVPGNEAADVLAGAGIGGHLYSNTVPLQDVKRWIDSTIYQAWANVWSRQEFPAIRKIKGVIGKWTDVASLREQRILSRLRTGHTRFSHNFGGGQFRTECEVCSVPASVEHMLCRCPQFERLRSLWGIPSSIRDLLGDNESTIAALMCFLKDADLYHRI